MTIHSIAQERRRKEYALIIAALASGCSHNDDIAEETGLPRSKVTAHLLALRDLNMTTNARGRGRWDLVPGTKVIGEEPLTWKEKWKQVFTFKPIGMFGTD